MMTWFADVDNTARAVSPGRLPTYQTCYAMMVHKTQGSEFGHVLLVLPEPPHSLLSRDLLYTGITRAKREAEVYGSEDAVEVGCCLLYTSPSPRDLSTSRMPSSA